MSKSGQVIVQIPKEVREALLISYYANALYLEQRLLRSEIAKKTAKDRLEIARINKELNPLREKAERGEASKEEIAKIQELKKQVEEIRSRAREKTVKEWETFKKANAKFREIHIEILPKKLEKALGRTVVPISPEKVEQELNKVLNA